MTAPTASRAALFVDFDNVYLGLQSVDPAAAEAFATDPATWIAAIADGDGRGGSRRFLIRNCYLNPSTFSRYRAYWTRAGFRVVDCPSLTQQGKSSTDINLVLDAVDVLAGEVRMDEFFIASADADFTSLVQRIRAADRQTTVIVAGAVARAYTAMADRVVDAEELRGLTTAKPALDAAAALPASDHQREVSADAELDSVPLHDRVRRVTNIPRLTKAQFALVITLLAADLGRHPFEMSPTTKRVRDACNEAGEPIARSAISFVTHGVRYGGGAMTAEIGVRELAARWVSQAESLCRGARMEFDDDEIIELRAWLGGGLASGPAE
ncbi:NYN domain-containing protein [Homoserinibacter sp. YIM 151385]|uniref:NYN domain-containing protein n=1 Tax=Homoserinibacter sp. YIM 151385 TaxID=2985506 RepID=UPI0022EFED7F|nr:NYN domain-containing protein [Homoserinibacter sp. YIM 151385]WBU37876.1 NYN domain-containing protein [Homoserinibacter sp. YIM 151385]